MSSFLAEPVCINLLLSGINSVFTALQTRSSDENSVRLSVGPFVKRVNSDKTEENSVPILYHTKYHLA